VDQDIVDVFMQPAALSAASHQMHVSETHQSLLASPNFSQTRTLNKLHPSRVSQKYSGDGSFDPVARVPQSTTLNTPSVSSLELEQTLLKQRLAELEGNAGPGTESRLSAMRDELDRLTSANAQMTAQIEKLQAAQDTQDGAEVDRWEARLQARETEQRRRESDLTRGDADLRQREAGMRAKLEEVSGASREGAASPVGGASRGAEMARENELLKQQLGAKPNLEQREKDLSEELALLRSQREQLASKLTSAEAGETSTRKEGRRRRDPYAYEAAPQEVPDVVGGAKSDGPTKRCPPPAVARAISKIGELSIPPLERNRSKVLPVICILAAVGMTLTFLSFFSALVDGGHSMMGWMVGRGKIGVRDVSLDMGIRHMCFKANDQPRSCKLWKNVNCRGLSECIACQSESAALFLPMLITTLAYLKLMVYSVQRCKGKESAFSKVTTIIGCLVGGLSSLYTIQSYYTTCIPAAHKNGALAVSQGNGLLCMWTGTWIKILLGILHAGIRSPARLGTVTVAAT